MKAFLRQTSAMTTAVVVATVALAACGKKTEPAAAETAPAAETGTSAATSPTTETTSRVPHAINTGEPVDGDATLSIPASVPAGSAFEIAWPGPPNAADYIDIVPRGYAQTSGEINYVYIRDAATVGKLVAPTKPGDYDVRYLAELKDGRVLKTVAPLTVAPVTVTFNAPPSAAKGGEPLSLGWNGPDNGGDYVDIVPRGYAATSGEITYAYTREGNPSALVTPGAPGEYEIRYVMEGRPERVIAATTPLTVTASDATLDAPATAAKGASIQVTWTGPDRRGDYVDLVPKDYADTSGELTYFYTTSGSPTALKIPDRAGEYEIRYVLQAPGGRQVLAKAPLKVE